MAHHHQLTAHSQLTTLSPGQIHYLQFPAGIIPAATVYHHHHYHPHNQHESLRTTSEITVGSCLFCLASLSPINTRTGKPLEYFQKACELLQVPINEILHEWNCEESEKHPFCSDCTEALHELMVLQNQLLAIQTRIEEGIEHIRRTLQNSNDRVPINDTRGFNFRSRALKYGTIVEEIATHIQESMDEENTNNIVSELTCLLNTPLAGLVIQHDSSIHSEQHHIISAPPSQTITYDSLEPDGVVQPSSPMEHSPSIYNQTMFTSLSDCVNNELSSQEDMPDVIVSIPDPNDVENYFFATTDDFNVPMPIDPQEDIIIQTSDGKLLQKKPEKSTKRRKRKNVTDDSGNDNKKSQNRTGATRNSNEEFAPIETDEEGRMTFEGVLIKMGEPGYICGLCDASCGKGHDRAAMRKIKIHIKGFHLGAYKCTTCNKNFTSSDILSQHTKRAHRVIDILCDICARPVKPRYVNSHKFTHMNAEEKAAYIAGGFKPARPSTELTRRFACRICKKMFKKRPVLLKHEASHLGAESRKEFKCQICDRTYTTGQGLRDHNLSHHDTMGIARKKMCPVCGKTMLAKALSKHLKSHVAKEDRPFVCKICGTRLVNAHYLQVHEAAHANENPDEFKVGCDICGKMFKSEFKMLSHIKNIHEKQKKLTVPLKLRNDFSIDTPTTDGYLEDLNNEELQQVQGKRYSYQMYHIEQVEDPLKGYQCCTCFENIFGEGDTAEEAVKMHIRAAHMGNYRCNLCTKRMKNLDEVLAHKRSEHLNVLTVNCEVCKKPGIPVKTYKTHLWLHKNPFDVADAINSGESLSSNGHVKDQQALLTKLGVLLSFDCALCSDKFEKVEDLYHHRVSIHPDAPKAQIIGGNRKGQKTRYSKKKCDCSHCGKRFKTEQELNKHTRQAHKKGRTDNGESEDGKHVQKRRQRRKKRKPVVTSSESEDDDDDSQSDPEFRVSSAILDDSFVSLRDRSTLRRRAQRNYSETDEDDAVTAQESDRDNLPIKLETIKEEEQSAAEYSTPEENGYQPFISEDDIKFEQDSQSSDNDDDE